MARVTSARDRSKRSTKRPVTQGQNPQRSNRQQVSQARVTSASNGKPKGSGSARVTTGMGSKLANAARAAGTALGLARGGVKAAVFKEGITARNTADGTLKGKPTGNPKGPSVPQRMTKAGVDKGSFDNAFRMARKGGAKTFTWRGKKYNTKLRGEK
jgi:hypothetical protein